MQLIHVTTIADKQAYLEQAWALLSQAYANVEGGLYFQSPSHLLEDTAQWSMALRHGKIAAITVFKNRNGLKMVAFAKGNQAEDRQALIDLLTEALSTGWMELSDAAEKFVMKYCGGDKFVLSARVAYKLLQKPVQAANDTYHYQREIMGKIKTKLALGSPSFAV